MRFETSLHWTLQWEGGYVNDPADKGGETNRGITKAVYDRFRKDKGLPFQSVKLISEAEVRALYMKYWDGCRAGAFDLPLARVLFDTAVNFGIGRSVQFLNQVLGLGDSMKVTTATRNSIKFLKTDPAKQLQKAKEICQKRIAYRHGRVQADPTQKRFLKGWLRRDNALLEVIS